ncbi:MAG: hypothetical protein LBH47_03765 [Christensenellaceae bacterium]|jgi:hypothetical protein|nr:hypothetical protein [Christensenellaceae bacterium]
MEDMPIIDDEETGKNETNYTFNNGNASNNESSSNQGSPNLADILKIFGVNQADILLKILPLILQNKNNQTPPPEPKPPEIRTINLENYTRIS